MPEYLAPAVYVEEVDTGSKPIEGVSTSTAGMVGMTERGPLNVPILITSNGEYQRWFGGYLDPDVFDAERCYLPHAVEGFFTNGGKRVFITRVLDPGAASVARRPLVAPDATAPATTQLLSSAAAAASSVIVADGTGFAAADTVQIGTGTGAEFRTINAPLNNASVLALTLPLSFEHAAAQTVEVRTIVDNPAPLPQVHSSTLQADAAEGARSITLVSAAFTPALAGGQLLRIGSGGTAEYIVVAGAPAGNVVPLRAPLRLLHSATAQVFRQDVTVPLGPPSTQVAAGGVAAGASVVNVASTAGFAAGDFLFFDHTNPDREEYRPIGGLVRLSLDKQAYANYPTGSLVEVVTIAPATPPSYDLTADAAANTNVIQVSNRSTMKVNDVVQIGLAADAEFAQIAAMPATAPGNNPGPLVLRSALRRKHDAMANVIFRFVDPLTTTFATTLAIDSAMDETSLIVAAAGSISASTIVRVTPPGGTPSYHVVSAAPVTLTARNVPLDLPLDLPHAAGEAMVTRTPMIEVRALDAGAWGNRLQVGAEVAGQPLLTTTIRQIVPGGLRLNSAAGVEAGTELVVTDAGGIETAHKVQAIDRQNNYLITLETGTPLPGTAAINNPVRSREYRFVVELLRQPDPANPSRNNTAIDREVFAALSLDPRHSRYFERIVGATWDTTNPALTQDDAGRDLRKSDRRSEGESAYIRVRDLSPGTGLRAGPVADYEVRPDGTRRLILLRLSRGDDALGAVTDAIYIGTDNTEPEQRTGLFTLRNIEDISIVAAPGRTSVTMQAGLINHCELARYRFAVLDGTPPPADTMTNVQVQRQQFDTKYAALYHPWLVIPEPYPLNPAMPADYPLPPSGHMLGIYARTDIERGVHKAPANEVVRGVTGLQRLLNKEQHDILNPYPVNINVIRDFRANNRGIRVYGGRVITSDSDWKYVNVRRLLIFIEASIDRGLQWVVFEPNAEPLWARVRRSVSNFLTQVWRNGALEGTRVEEAFFVKCDRTTMTQTDIDQGRLICLVGVAPVKPAEFVIVRIGLWTAHAEE
ncbi:phage tail sheath C-terminal domain-containing protein [Bradyrhizobium liaoningense]|uniref:phage tail sheath family protein n=1 Tax=Bradyrhizobium liaoningense TaxID=43992 RepID=UPI001BAD9C63|nr:phage tail sheath C-terminal domain-containing protein [Bradyrhizobium liaoningense]MBR0820213.1 phage tail sheath subtilisin-like domain-containing protein [Bradyrhizobium liaoningense]